MSDPIIVYWKQCRDCGYTVAAHGRVQCDECGGAMDITDIAGAILDSR